MACVPSLSLALGTVTGQSGSRQFCTKTHVSALLTLVRASHYERWHLFFVRPPTRALHSCRCACVRHVTSEHVSTLL